MYTLGEQIPHADALSGMDFDDAESENDRVCFEINNIYFAQRDLVTHAEIKTELGTKQCSVHKLLKCLCIGRSDPKDNIS